MGARLENVCTSPEKAGAFEPIGSEKYLLCESGNEVRILKNVFLNGG